MGVRICVCVCACDGVSVCVCVCVCVGARTIIIKSVSWILWTFSNHDMGGIKPPKGFHLTLEILLHRKRKTGQTQRRN